MRPFPSDLMTFYPVSTHVNNPRNEDPACIAPLNS
jgi:putative SOS response-associated peptidase YedK